MAFSFALQELPSTVSRCRNLVSHFFLFIILSTSLATASERCSSQLQRLPVLAPMKPLSGIQLIEGHPKFHLNADRTLQGWSGSSSPFLNRGTSNKGTFLLTNRHGVRSVLKIFPHSVNTEIPTQFLKKLDGMRLQALQGGPQILDFGALNRADGSPLFFVQMECMFCDSQAINLKDIDPDSENLIIHLEDQGHQVLGKFGQLLARAFENHL